jgi:hypothetical protein
MQQTSMPFMSLSFIIFVMMSLYRELVVHDVPLNVRIIGSPFVLHIRFVLTSHLPFKVIVISVHVICPKIFRKILCTVFANASPSLLTYPISPAYCIPLLTSVLWSLTWLVK